MKLIIDNDNNIVCKVSKNITNKEIKDIIKDKILNNSYKQAIKFINGLDEIEYHTGFSIDLGGYDGENNIITIHGDNGLIDLEIIDLKTIKEL
tara:strand:+ start:49 stop:327 length:279 start_codon:yes stop_codon:yes gene_type:complete